MNQAIFLIKIYKSCMLLGVGSILNIIWYFNWLLKKINLLCSFCFSCAAPEALAYPYLSLGSFSVSSLF